jgi:superfamily II DNA helicase RecQ
VTADSFEAEGKTIAFQRAWLTSPSRSVSPDVMEFTLPDGAGAIAAGTARGKRVTRGKGGKGGKASKAGRSKRTAAAAPADEKLVARHKQWRLAEARRGGVPAFRIFSDRTLLALAATRPRDESSLLGVPGIGPALLKRYGSTILGMCR